MNQKQPFFSIIIPTYNREQTLAKGLSQIVDLDYPKERFEVIVVDDGSKISPKEALQPFKNQLQLTLITQPNLGAAAARNRGAEATKGDFLAFIDDDCSPSPQWLKTFAKGFSRRPDMAIAGRTVNALTDNLYSVATHLLLDFVYEYYNGIHEKARFIASGNMAASAPCFRQMQGFNPSFSIASEDREFSDRWLSFGYGMSYMPEAVASHSRDLDFASFCRQHFNYGRGAFRFHQLRLKRLKRTYSMEPPFYYLKMLSYPLIKTKSLSLFALILISQIASCLGYGYEGLSRIEENQING